MIDTEGFWDYVKKNGIKMNDIEDDSKIILSQPEIKLLKNITVNKYLLFDLYQLLFTKKFQQLILCKLIINFNKGSIFTPLLN